MRVSEPTKVSAVINNMNTTAAKQQKLAEQISSGKRVLRPSDDPAASDKIELYKRDIQRGETITKDSNYNQLWLNLVDSSTSQMVDILRQAKVKALEAANSYQTEESQQAIAAEVEALQQELEGLANSKLDKVYIYSGSRSLTPPLLKNAPENIPSYNMVQNWWLSKASVGKEELNTLVEASRNDDLLITLKVGELDPADNPGPLPPEGRLIGGEQEIRFRVLPSDTRETLVNKLNAAFAARYADVKDPNFPGEKIQDAYFYLAPDGKIGVQSYPNVELTFGPALQEVLNFEAPPKSSGAGEAGMFGESISGYHEKPYIVRVTKGGEIGQATYTVSDDGGKTWSREKVLDWTNQIFNPEGDASNQVTLNFARPGMRLFFCPGLEFQFKENPVVRYQGNDDKRMVPTETAEKTTINTTARQLFFHTTDNTVNVFDVLERLKNNVVRSDIPEISKQMDELDASINQVLKFRAKAGVTSRRLQNTTDRIASKNFEETTALSDAQDLDIAKASTDLNQNQIQQQAAMETTARVLSQSLVQFLR